MLELALLDHISPDCEKLLSLVPTVHIVEDGELGTQEVGEVSDLNIAQVVAYQELMMPDHGPKPLVVGPSSETRDGVNGADVEEEENNSSSAS